MKRSKLFNAKVLSSLIIAISILLSTCEKKESAEDKTVSGQVGQFETTLIDSSARMDTTTVDYGEIMQTVFQLEDSIKRNPMDVSIRSALVTVAYDSTSGKIYTVGYGIADTSAGSEARAMQTAERAALIDAQRWAMFVMRWKENADEPAITETVSGNVPRGTPIQKAILPENNLYLLVEFEP